MGSGLLSSVAPYVQSSFEASLIPGSISMVGSSDRAKSGFCPGFVGPDLEGKKRAQELTSAVPSDACANLDQPRTSSSPIKSALKRIELRC